MAQKLKFTIVNIERDPRTRPGEGPRSIISLKINDGAGEPYIKAFSLVDPPQPLTEEQFMDLLVSQDLARPADPWGGIRGLLDSGTEREINLTRNLDGE